MATTTARRSQRSRRSRTTGALVALLTLAAAFVAARPAEAAEAPGYVALTPVRILDTREGNGAPQAKVGPGQSIDLQVTGRGGVPSEGVEAVALNVTVTGPTDQGWITVWPTGEAKPFASNLNFIPGQSVPNLVIVQVGTGGKVSLANSHGQSDLVADVAGYYASGADFTPTNPVRLLDTRSGLGGVQGPTSGETVVTLTGKAGIPADARSVVLNVTVTEPTSSGWLTVWPNGAARPNASNLNFYAGSNVPNLVIAKVGTGGAIKYSNPAGGTVHVVMDVLGYTTGRTLLTQALDPSASANGGATEVVAASLGGVIHYDSIRFEGPTPVCSTDQARSTSYALGGAWRTLTTTVGLDDDFSNSGSKIRFRIFGDSDPEPLSQVDRDFGQAPVPVTVDVTGVQAIRFEVLNRNVGGTPCSHNPVFGEPQLTAAAGAGFPDPAEYTPLLPFRLLDTRDGTGAAVGKVGPDGKLDLQVTGRGAVPSSGVSAVVLNLTVTGPTSDGWFTAWPTGGTKPLASNVNFLPDQTVANLAIVKVGTDGKVSIANARGQSHVVADVLGWFPG